MSYTRVNWENETTGGTGTPLSAENLNVMDKGIKDLDSKLDQNVEKVNNLEGQMVVASPTRVGFVKPDNVTTKTDPNGTITAIQEVKKSDINAINKRIENLVLHSGDSNPEVVDARIDPDGKIYPTLKDRIDADTERLSDIYEDGFASINLLNSNIGNRSVNGVNCIDNGNGTYTLNGTSTGVIYLKIADIKLKAGRYRLTGVPTKDSGLVIYDETFSFWEDGNGNNVTLTEDKSLTFTLNIAEGKSFSNTVLKPMIVDASKYPNTTYNDFEQYAESNVALTTKLSQSEEWLCGRELYNKNALESGKFFDASGAIAITQMWGIEYVPIEANKAYLFEGVHFWSGASCIWADDNKNLISVAFTRNDNSPKFAIAPPNAKYFGMSVSLNNPNESDFIKFHLGGKSNVEITKELFDIPKIKKGTFSMTTQSNGALGPIGDSTKMIPIGFKLTSDSVLDDKGGYFLQGNNGTKWYLMVRTPNDTPLANKLLSIEFYYIDLE